MKRPLKKEVVAEIASVNNNDDVSEEKADDTYQLQRWSPMDGMPAVLPGLLVAQITFGVYFATSFPSISGGDSGEQLMASCQHGVAHPPGYPTFTMQTTLAMYLPVSPARAGNIQSCFFSASSVFCIYMCVIYISKTKNAFLGLLASLQFAFNPSVWLYAGQSEVFALNNFLCAFLMLLTLYFFHVYERELSPPVITMRNIPTLPGKTKKHKDLATKEQFLDVDISSTSYALCIGYVGAFFCGIAMTNQHTTVFYVFAIAASIALRIFISGRLSLSISLYFILSVFLGMLPYLYMPVASSYIPADTWGDQTTLSGFFRHFLRVEYGTFQLAADGHVDPGMWSRLQRYIVILSTEAGYHVIPCFVIALVVLLRSSNKVISTWTGTMLFAYILYTGVFHKLANLELTPLYLGVQARFWMQSNLFLLPVSMQGFEAIFTMYTWKHMKTVLSQTSLVLTLVHLGMHLPSLHNGHNYILHNMALETLETFDANAIVLLNGDLNHNLQKYFTSCEEKRKDLDLLSVQLMSWEWFHRQRVVYPRVSFPGKRYHPFQNDSFSMDAFLQANKQRPVYLCGTWKDGDPTTNNKYTQLQSGTCSRVQYTQASLQEQAKLYEQSIGNIPHQEKAFQTEQIYLDFPHQHVVLDTLPSVLQLAPIVTLESWEYAWVKDAVIQARYIHSYLAMIASQNAQTTPALLEASKRVHEYIFAGDTLPEYANEFNGCRKKQHCIPLIHYIQAFQQWTSDDDRAAGVIYGMYAEVLQTKIKHTKNKQEIKDLQQQQALCDRKMLYFWSKAVKAGKIDLKPFTDRKYNPYTGKEITMQQGWIYNNQLTNPFISDVVKFNKRT